MNVDIEKLEQLMRDATPGPVVASLQDADEETWALHGNDPSYEATLAQFWSGEHNNEANAKLHEALHNSCAALIERIRAGDRLLETASKLLSKQPCSIRHAREAIREYEALKGEANG